MLNRWAMQEVQYAIYPTVHTASPIAPSLMARYSRLIGSLNRGSSALLAKSTLRVSIHSATISVLR